MSDPKLNDPEVNSEFARGKRLAEEKGAPPGVDPVSGEIASVSYRTIFNAVNGDEKRAKEIFNEVAEKGGYGVIENPNQFLDIRSLERARDDDKKLIERGVDREGRKLDLFGKRAMEQQAQHHDSVMNDVREVLEKIKKG